MKWNSTQGCSHLGWAEGSRRALPRNTTHWHTCGRAACPGGICLRLWLLCYLWPTRKRIPNLNHTGQSPARTPLEGCHQRVCPAFLAPSPPARLYQRTGKAGLHGLKEGNHRYKDLKHRSQQPVLENDRPTSAQRHKHIIRNPPNS